MFCKHSQGHSETPWAWLDYQLRNWHTCELLYWTSVLLRRQLVCIFLRDKNIISAFTYWGSVYLALRECVRWERHWNGVRSAFPSTPGASTSATDLWLRVFTVNMMNLEVGFQRFSLLWLWPVLLGQIQGKMLIKIVIATTLLFITWRGNNDLNILKEPLKRKSESLRFQGGLIHYHMEWFQILLEILLQGIHFTAF